MSRKQLPAVDVNGNVRYSTPSGETEIEWLSRGGSSTSSSDRCRSLSVENQRRNFSASYSTIDSRMPVNSVEETANYWNGGDKDLLRVQRASETFSEDIDSDWSHDSKVRRWQLR